MRKHLTILIWYVALHAGAAPSDSLRHWGGELKALPGTVITADKWQNKWQQGKRNAAVELKLTHASLPADSNDYDRDYGYPTLSLGAMWSFNHRITMHKGARFWGEAVEQKEVDYVSRAGNILSLYGEFARPLLRRRRWELDYTLALGAGWSRHKYNTQDNIDNELIGSRWLIYVGLGTHATFHFAHAWGVRLGLDFYHHSNGALNRPNKGLNILSPSVGLVYQPYYDASIKSAGSIRKPFRRYWYLNVAVGVGARTLEEEWQYTQFILNPDDADYRTSQFRLYTTLSMQADVMYRYARRWASGVGTDFFYACNAVGRINEINALVGQEGGAKPWSAGLAFKHEAFYRNLSFNASLGFYLYRKDGYMGEHLKKPYYERIGVNYAFPALGGLKAGFNVKAHGTKADLTEIIISCPLRLTRK